MNLKYFIFCLLITINIFSQKVKDGNIKALKGVNEYKLEFDYTDLSIANYESEETFLKDKVGKRERVKKGSGLKFKENWYNYRTSLYEPKFENSFDNYFIMKRKITVSRYNPNAKYTIKIKTISIYPGYNVKAAWESTKLKVEITIVETNQPNNTIITFKPIKISNGKADFNLGQRIANAYGVLGIDMARFLRKKT